MKKATKAITLALLGPALLLPGCRNEDDENEASSGSSGYYGGSGYRGGYAGGGYGGGGNAGRDDGSSANSRSRWSGSWRSRGGFGSTGRGFFIGS